MESKLLNGNNIELLRELEDNSVDSVVTDPPYGLSFMNKKWDYDVPSTEFWTEVFRVLKPGGHVLSFGGTRTYHRMVVNMEDAGFEIRDQIQWLYGSGFPKSHNIGKAYDKKMGNERVPYERPEFVAKSNKKEQRDSQVPSGEKGKYTKGTSPYEGWGTALKPANEPICLARKPFKGTVVDNVIKWGTGGINIDECRIGNEERTIPIHSDDKKDDNTLFGLHSTIQHERISTTEGRFPANIILDEEAGKILDEQSGISKSSSNKWQGENNSDIYGKYQKGIRQSTFSDEGGASRFFYQAKVSEEEKQHSEGRFPANVILDEEAGEILDEQSGILKSGKFKEHHKRGKTLGEYQGSCYGKYNNQEEMLNPDKTYGDEGGASRFFYSAKVSKKERNKGTDKNNHPTVKPVSLMSYLCRLITPKGGVVLDPFMGSGSTGISALLEGFNFIGMEMDEDYFNIAERRIDNYEEYRQFIKK